ncbi:SMP-30/gluconolactonase/LRE family protein [Frigoribacterium sp. 2-23]|uniref:SMP-30/gluconolactonase/LRE family protein n=1 Tax=Frigoribacterium sp. 2-23 TaxID=3415006 RepID=UPI003C6FDF12
MSPTPASPSEPRLFYDAKAELAESPVWDVDAQELLWTDITAGALHRTSADGLTDRMVVIDPPLPSFQRRRGGGLVAALDDRILVMDDDGSRQTTIATVEHADERLRLNEGKCDPFGAFVVGAVDPEGEPLARLYRVAPDGTVTLLRDDFATTNGFEWNDDGSEIYLTDTGTETIYRASWNADGELGELVPFSSGGAHDGLARDERGEFWGAIYGEGVVVHLDRTGDEIERVGFPVPNLTGIGFGGADLRTLFVLSARENLSPDELARYPESGGLFALELDRAGRAPFLFG